MILKGRITVNGKRVQTVGIKVDPNRDRIRVDGRELPRPASKVYFILNKPRGVISSRKDPEGRPTVIELLPNLKTRVYPVGRLDFNSEGLLLLTNDGDWAQRLMHPSSHLPRVYLVKIRGIPSPAKLDRLKSGIQLDDGPAHADKVEITRCLAKSAWIKIRVTEGRNRMIRRMFEAIGHPIVRLMRVSLGPMELGNLKSGQHKSLKPSEIRMLDEYIDKINKI
jgi:23S rRNA pseudouridine2605 synthase